MMTQPAKLVSKLAEKEAKWALVNVAVEIEELVSQGWWKHTLTGQQSMSGDGCRRGLEFIMGSGRPGIFHLMCQS